MLVHLRERLRAGDIWVDGSRAWRSFEGYLLPRPIFALMRAEGRLGLAIPGSFAEWRAERTATLDAKKQRRIEALLGHLPSELNHAKHWRDADIEKIVIDMLA